MENIGDHFIVLPTIDSTNIYAMQQVHARLTKHGTAYFAHHQTLGKGQRGKAWESGKNENIALSVVYEPVLLNLSGVFLLSASVALGCYNFCKVHLGEQIAIKWPNDIYWGDRKAGGILVENLIRGDQWEFAIAGIGININQVNFPDDLPNPVSFRQIIGKILSPVALAQELCTHLQQSWSLLLEDESRLLRDYNTALYKKGEVVKLKQDNRSFQARIEGVGKNGQLEVFTAIPESLNYGEVSWLL